MKSVTRLAAAALAAAICSGTAHAADMDVPIVVDQAPEFVPVEIGNGWYLRGDIGYSVASSGGASTYRTFNGTGYGSDMFDDSDIEAELSASLGVGYHFTNMFRGDLTAERFKGDFFGGTSSPWSCSDPTDTSTGCVSNDSASFTAYSLMANAYVDLATVMHVTPYVGAGIGMTYVDWGPLSNTLYCVSGTLPCGGAYAGASTHGGLDSWRLTYALMAGASYKLTKNTELDFGYRWRHVDGGDFFSFTDTEISAGAVGAQAEDDGFDTHEIRVGLRYDLW